MELKCQVYFLLFDGVRFFLGLTCDFWAENPKNKLWDRKDKGMRGLGGCDREADFSAALLTKA